MLLVRLALLFVSSSAFAINGKHFDRVVTVIFENTNYSETIKQPFFKHLADSGAHFTNFLALTHPSQGNYIALTSGAINGVSGDGNFDLNVNNIVDLLEAKGISWKVYAEDYPGNCFKKNRGKYVRKHNPFISYLNIQSNSARCSQIVNADQFDADATAGRLPSYVFYIPNLDNDAHDTDVSFADRWYDQKFSAYVNNPNFMRNTILVSTFDESGPSRINQIYTTIVGPAVKPGIYSQTVNLISLLTMVEDNWSLGNLGRDDTRAPAIPNIWR